MTNYIKIFLTESKVKFDGVEISESLAVSCGGLTINPLYHKLIHKWATLYLA